ncbi:MAG: VWA domain-containing protein [Pyrinomonadaceae bacterium]|nr:VWA domain-containing protein [Pyrinomonadaceae bacterium]
MENDQKPFIDAELAENPEPRCPCLLLLDTSASMKGAPISELNEALHLFKNELMLDSMTAKRVEISIVTFGPVEIVTDFTPANSFYPPQLSANGDTPLGKAIETGIKLLKIRKQRLRENGVDLYRPWIFLITDGDPTDEWRQVISQIQTGEEHKSFLFFALAVNNARLDVLRQISVREPVKLNGIQFRPLFRWLSDSLKAVSHSNPNERLALPDHKPYGWAEIE